MQQQQQQQQQQQHVRPISTYDNLNANAATKTKLKPELGAGESAGQLQLNNDKRSLPYDSVQIIPNRQLQQMADQATEPTETSHSIAAVRAALSDAKSKFFGINNYDTLDAALPSFVEDPVKPESKFQSVPLLPEASRLQPMKTTTKTTIATPSPEKSMHYCATYEQISLNDPDGPQPSQAVYMSTTVPQNMKGMQIAGRHTPTRNSLRHSRMIVVNNKNHDSIQQTYSTHIRNLNLSRQLLILQLAIGLLIVGLAIWILILAPNASILINPYLSGLSLLLASIAGLILLGRDRRAEHHRSHNNCYKVLLAESYVFSALALIFCCLALVCAAIEFAALTSTDGACGPSSLLSYRNCNCTEAPNAAVPESVPETAAEDVSSNYNCEAMRGEWKYLLGFSMALNSLGIFATFLYITIFICCHRSSRKHFHTSV